MNTQGSNNRNYKRCSGFAAAGCKIGAPGGLKGIAGTLPDGQARRKGAAVVEFAVLAPLLFLLVYGMLEYGRLIMVQQIITNASREGSRRAALEGSTQSGVQTAVNNYLASSSISGASVAVSPDPAVAGPGDPMTVTVSVNYDNVSWLPTSIYLGGRVLSASSTMRHETAQ